MPTSLIRVYDSNRSRPAAGVDVRLEWTGIVNLGFSNTVTTDKEGVALISHSSSGTANVYVNGRRVSTVRTPGDTTVTI